MKTITREQFNAVAGRWIPDEVADAMEEMLFDCRRPEFCTGACCYVQVSVPMNDPVNSCLTGEGTGVCDECMSGGGCCAPINLEAIKEARDLINSQPIPEDIGVRCPHGDDMRDPNFWCDACVEGFDEE